MLDLRWAATISAMGIPSICPLESDAIGSTLVGRTRCTDVALAVTVAIVSVGNNAHAFASASSGDVTSVLASFRLFSRRSSAGRLGVEMLVEEEETDDEEALGLRSDVG